MSKSYAEKLKDPRWQKKRLEILERDEWECQICYDKEKTLHVHHCWYDPKGKDPWDYENVSLRTLCEDCHKKEHKQFKINIDDLVEIIKTAGLLSIDVYALIKVISGEENPRSMIFNLLPDLRDKAKSYIHDKVAP